MLALVLAIALVSVFVVAALYFSVWPLLKSWYSRNPWIFFPMDSLRWNTFREELRSNDFRWFLNHYVYEQPIWTHWSFIWVLAFGIPVTISIGHLITIFGRPSITASVATAWQAQLTITGLSFIVLIFLMDQVYRSRYREGVIQEFLAESRAMPVIFYALISSGLLAYLAFYESPKAVPPLISNTAFSAFAGTVLLIGYVYFRVVRLVFTDPLDELTVERVKTGLMQQIREWNREQISHELLQNSTPDFVRIGSNLEGRVLTADEIGLHGYISDINLRKLEQACIRELDSFDQDGAILHLDLELGAELNQGMDLVYVSFSGNISPELSPEFADQLEEAISCSSTRPVDDGDKLVERNMAKIREETKKSAEELRQAGLENYLKLYTGLLEYATTLNREVIEKYESTPKPIGDFVDRIFRRFYAIFEAVGRTGDSELVNTVRGELFRISLMFHKQGETMLFEKSISLYRQYYHALASVGVDNQSKAHGVLSSFQDLQMMLGASLRDARTVEECEKVISNLESYYETLERILEVSLDHGDADTFNKAWNLGEDPFVLVNPESDIYEIEWKLENTDSEEEINRFEEELDIRKTQKEAIEKINSSFEMSRFVAAAHSFKLLGDGEISEQVFQEIFHNSIVTHYSNFNSLNEAYFRFFDEMRLDFLNWETDDIDIFKGVRMSQPAVHDWLKQFYCVMALILLDLDELSEDVDEAENPLAEVDIERGEYPDIASGVEQIAREDLEKMGLEDSILDTFEERQERLVALSEQVEDILEEQEEDYIIESAIDSEKVQNYQENYSEKFEESFVVREIFRELGWLESEPYTDELDHSQIVLNHHMPRGAFIEEPPIDYIKRFDQKVRRHTNGVLEQWFGDDAIAEIELGSYDELEEKFEAICGDAGDVKAVVVSRIKSRQAIAGSDHFDPDFGDKDDILGGFETGDETIPVYVDSSRDFAALLLTGGNDPQITEYRKDDSAVDVVIEEVTREFLKKQEDVEFEQLTEEEIRDRLQQVWIHAFYYWNVDQEGRFGKKIVVDES
jgi:hypothetical protein